MNDPEREPDELLASSPWLRRFVGTLVAPDDADDLAQATRLAALQAPPPATTEWRRWLAGIGRNLARMLHRSRARSQRALARLPRAGESPSAADLVQGLEVQRAVSEAMLALPEPTRTILVLRYQHDLPPAAIALRVGLQEPAVRQRLHRGREEVRARLQQRFGADWRGSFAVLAFVGQQAVRRGAGAVLLAGAAALAIVVAGTFLLAATSMPAVAPVARDDLRQSSDENARATDERVARDPAVGTLGRERVATMQDPPLRGQVVDEVGAPIAGATIGCIFDYDRFVTADLVAAPAARTDEGGWFSLPRPAATNWPIAVSCSARGRGTVVVAPYHLDLGPVTLPPVRRLAGRVRDPEGRAVAGARILVRDWLSRCEFVVGRGGERRFEAPEPCSGVRSGADGRFVVESAVDTALYVEVHGRGFESQAHGPWDSSQSLDFVLHPVVNMAFEVRGAEGQPVAGAKVEVHRTGPEYPWSEVVGNTGPDGVCHLPRLSGAFYVWADHEPTGARMSRFVDHFGEREVLILDPPPSPQAVASPAAASNGVSVRVRFRDPSRDEPVVGGTVWFADGSTDAPSTMGFRWIDSRPNTVALATTDGEGCCTTTLPPGTYWLGGAEHARGARYLGTGHARNPEPRRIEIASDREPAEILLELQPTFELAGRIDTGGLPAGSCLRFEPVNMWTDGSAGGGLWPRVALDGDGGFVATTLQQADYRVQMLLPRLLRQGRADVFEVERLAITSNTQLKIDAAKARPALARGRVVGQLPLPRLAVVSLAVTDESREDIGYVSYSGPVAPLERDGSFVLREPPGRRSLIVVDLRTGVMLHRAAVRDVGPGSASDCELRPEVHRCALRCETSAPLETMALEIEVEAARGPGGLGHMNPRMLRPYSTHLAPDHAGFELLLPPGLAKLSVVQHPRHQREQVVHRDEVQATAGGRSELTLRVP